MIKKIDEWRIVNLDMKNVQLSIIGRQCRMIVPKRGSRSKSAILIDHGMHTFLPDLKWSQSESGVVFARKNSTEVLFLAMWLVGADLEEDIVFRNGNINDYRERNLVLIRPSRKRAATFHSPKICPECLIPLGHGHFTTKAIQYEI